MRDVPRCDRPKSLPEFVQEWGQMPLLEWPLKLEVLQDILTSDHRLLDPELDGRPTQLCSQLILGQFKLQKLAEQVHAKQR